MLSQLLILVVNCLMSDSCRTDVNIGPCQHPQDMPDIPQPSDCNLVIQLPELVHDMALTTTGPDAAARVLAGQQTG